MMIHIKMRLILRMAWMSGRFCLTFSPLILFKCQTLKLLVTEFLTWSMCGWTSTTNSNKILEYPKNFIQNIHSSVSILDLSHSTSTSPSSFSDKQHLCFETIVQHFNQGENAEPLNMIIQGTARNWNSYHIWHSQG